MNADELIELGAAAQRKDRWRDALAYYDRAISAESGNAIAYQLRGALRLELGRHYDALHDFDRSIQLAPYSEVGYLGKGHVFMALKDYRWAVIQFTNAIDQLPDDAPELVELYLDRAKAYTLIGDREGLVSAEKDRQRAANLS